MQSFTKLLVSSSPVSLVSCIVANRPAANATASSSSSFELDNKRLSSISSLILINFFL
ncbi:MAG: hypothetical protein ACKVHI_12065 [Candidatus Puniceispirillales bacterium]